MAKKSQLTDTDKAAFKAAMRGVKPLKPQTKIIERIPPSRVKRRQEPVLEGSGLPLFPFSDYETLTPIASDDYIEFFRSGIQDKIIRKMRTGQYTIEAKLDLHGLIVAEAREALSRFIAKCCRKRIRNVLIVHGKGRAHLNPILKNKLNHWLRQTPDVLAFCSAKAKDGSTGALYALLRRSRL